MPGKRTVSAKRRAASRSNGRKSAGLNTLAGKRIVSLNAMKSSTATPGCERGANTPAARATALRHKMETPRRSDPSDQENHEEMVRRIYEVYGLTPPEPEENRPQPSPRGEGGEPIRSSSNRPEQGEGAHGKLRELGEGSRPHFSEKARRIPPVRRVNKH